MEGSFKERFTAGALAAGAVALCATGAAGAVQLVTGKDIRDGSLQLKDLSKRAQTKLKAGAPRSSLLVSSLFLPDGTPAGAVAYTAPGGDFSPDDDNRGQLQLPPSPGSGFRVRGLRAASLDTNGSGASDSQTFTLRLNGVDTALSCVANVANGGVCSDQATVVARPGDRLSIRSVNTAPMTVSPHAIVALSIEAP